MSEKTQDLVVQETKTELNMETSEVAIKNLIYVIRGQQVMLDSDLAMLYHVDSTTFLTVPKLTHQINIIGTRKITHRARKRLEQK